MADTFYITKKGTNNFWHTFNGGAKEVNLSDFQIVLDSQSQTFNIQCKNGSNIPKNSVLVTDIIVIDETDASIEETFLTVELLRTRLVALGYTPYFDFNDVGLTADEYDAIHNANSPSASNVFATMADVGGGGGSQDLEQVLTEGNESTTKDAIFRLDADKFLKINRAGQSIEFWDLAVDAVNYVGFYKQDEFSIRGSGNTFGATPSLWRFDYADGSVITCNLGIISFTDSAGLVTDLRAGNLQLGDGTNNVSFDIDRMTVNGVEYLYPTGSTSPLATEAYANGLVVGLWDDRGSFDASVNAYPSSGGSGTLGAILKGDTWTVSVAGTLPSSQSVEVGDIVRALINTPGNTQANWAIQQNNIGYTAENTANKTDTMAGNTASSTKYLSAKGVYDWATGLFQTLASFASDVRATVLTGFSAAAGSVSSSDSILSAINKIVGNQALKVDKSTWTDYSATSTIVGWSSFTTKNISYKIVDDMLFCSFYIEGASNNTATSFTLPNNNTSGFSIFTSAGLGFNNVLALTTPPRIGIPNGSNVVSIARDTAGTGWTGTGTKSVAGEIWFKIN